VTESSLTAAADLIAGSPYARFLGVRIEADAGGLIGVLPFAPELVGNPILPALHGGVVAAFLELTALAQLAAASTGAAPRTVDYSIDYLRPARAVQTQARAEVIRLGRRVAAIRATAWQAHEAQPVALLRGQFLLERRE
jgi:uncharacterized protein (TIGR00369 family)